MSNRSFLDIMTNIFGIFVLIILYFVLTFMNQDIMSVEGVLLPVESQIDKDYFYLELAENYVLPLGLGGKCDPAIYKTINMGAEAHMCIALPEVLEVHRKEFNIYNQYSSFNKMLETLPSDKVYFVLLTRPSAFDVYHEVAHKIREAGFDAGWFPVEEEIPLKFSTGGRRIGVQ